METWRKEVERWRKETESWKCGMEDCGVDEGTVEGCWRCGRVEG